ncbi:MAG: hypothetical protein [Circular genetic element sp.]|nr:MAG: hypothetical protein [Circular genetic element sp.]
MPYRKRRSKAPPRNTKKTQRRAKSQVRSFPRQIQNAAYIPRSRLVKFTDYRSFMVKDTGGSATYSYPPLLQVGLNDPTKFIESTQGTWDKTSMDAKGPAVPGIGRWLSNKIPGTTSTADYLTGSCIGAKLDITVCPLAQTATDSASYQQMAKVVLANQTRAGHLKGRVIDNTLNAERVSQMPMVRTANIYLNTGGTPRGATLSLRYSFRKNNAAPGKQSDNLFFADTSPLEKDIGTLIILPSDTNGYGVGGTKVMPCRVEVRVSYIVQLSEPNTHIGQAMNDGTSLVGVDAGVNTFITAADFAMTKLA